MVGQKKYGRLAKALKHYSGKKSTKFQWDEEVGGYKEIKNDITYREEVLEVIWVQAKKEI